MSIVGDQNSKDNLLLLAAQSYLYSEAKCIVNIKIIISIGLVISAFLTNMFPQMKLWTALVGAVWTLISAFIINNIINERIKTVAKIQEEFDTGLFKLSWNDILVGSKVPKEIIISASEKYKGGPLTDWYPDLKETRYPLSILICQRANLVWDWRLREFYAWCVLIICLALLAVEIILGLNTMLIDFLITFFLPSLPAFMLSVETVYANFKVAREKKQKEEKIMSIIHMANARPNSINIQICRQIQDLIYFFRINTALVPDLMYRIFQRKFNIEMNKAAEQINRESLTESVISEKSTKADEKM
jgi:hypothetical protein